MDRDDLIMVYNSTTTRSTNTISNFNNTQVKFSLDSMIDKTLLKIEVLTMSLVFTLALIGNSIVIITLLIRHYAKTSESQRNRKTKFTRMNFFILHLSIADIYVSVGNILTMLLWRMNNNIFYGGDIACRLVVYFQLVSVYYSTYVLITMTLDRYEAICKPLLGLSWSKQRGLFYISIAFVISHLQGIPQIMFFALRTIPNSEPEVQTCYAIFNPLWLQNGYIIYTWVMQFMIPLCIIIVCYASISIKVFNSIKNKNGGLNKREKVYKNSTEIENTKRLLNIENEFSISDKNPNTICVRSSLDTNQMLFSNKMALKKNLSNNSFLSNKEISYSETQSRQTSIKHANKAEFRQHCQKNFSKSKMKTIKLTLTVIILYIICSTPYFIGMILNVMLSPSLFSVKIISNHLNKKLF